ncbi:MAG: hypothetical protein ABF904_07405 [Ethanoligenens sp.]
MAYADAAFYTGTYGGTIPADAALDTLLAQASDDIDNAAYGRIGALGGFNALTPFCQKQVQMAVCAQADHLQTTGSLSDLGGVNGYTIGDVTVRLSGAADLLLAPRAREYLTPTMLLFRGV